MHQTAKIRNVALSYVVAILDATLAVRDIRE